MQAITQERPAQDRQEGSDLHLEHRPLDALIPYARNARTHSESQVALIAGSIREFGFTNPVLVDGANGIRRLLIIGAMSRIASARRHDRQAEPWLQDKLDRKPRMVAAIALANKMARQIWAMLTRGETYKAPAFVRPEE